MKKLLIACLLLGLTLTLPFTDLQAGPAPAAVDLMEVGHIDSSVYAADNAYAHLQAFAPHESLVGLGVNTSEAPSITNKPGSDFPRRLEALQDSNVGYRYRCGLCALRG